MNIEIDLGRNGTEVRFEEGELHIYDTESNHIRISSYYNDVKETIEKALRKEGKSHE